MLELSLIESGSVCISVCISVCFDIQRFFDRVDAEQPKDAGSTTDQSTVSKLQYPSR